ncbi:MAG: ABC transporter permease [Burkholderiaceae bacterium]
MAPTRTDSTVLRQAIEALPPGTADGAPRLGWCRPTLSARSLHIFDRSHAVTYWLQAVAIGIGLFGVAASFGARVLARRKEFGLLARLGLTRRQILAVVAGEERRLDRRGRHRLLLGLAVSVVLVHVVNPQSFRLDYGFAGAAGAAGAVRGRGTGGDGDGWVAGRAAAGRDAMLAVKEDW